MPANNEQDVVLQMQPLVTAFLQGTADADQVALLEDLLLGNESLQQVFLEQVIVDSMLSWELRTQLAASPASLNESIASTVSIDWSSTTIRTARRWAAFAVAACLVAAALVYRGSPQHDSPSVAADSPPSAGQEGLETLALVTASTQAGDGGTRVGDRLQSGAYDLGQGEELEFQMVSDVKIRCEGPAKLKLENPMKISLQTGKITAVVPKQAIGFTVQTPELNVTDLGTVFGVEIDDETGVEVVVIQGSVDVERASARSGGKRRLKIGEGVYFSSATGFNRLASVVLDPSTNRWASNRQSTRPGIRTAFASVADDLSPDTDSLLCYRIVPGGIHEDALAYTDRTHEWNSMPNSPMPEWLRGADAIQRRNSQKRAHVAACPSSVSVVESAFVFVLWDERCDPLPWLSEGFRDTSFTIGLDEGSAAAALRKRDVGAGKSVDTSYRVWARRVEQGGSVTLGRLGNEDKGGGRNMYGIAAMPISRMSDQALASLEKLVE